MGRSTPINFLGRGLHQDFGYGANSPKDLARDLLSFLTPEEKLELRSFLDTMLISHTSSELKGLLNRASREIRFNSVGARNLLEAVQAELR